MKLIDISTAKHPNTFAKVDDEDFELLSKFKWHAKFRTNGPIYAATAIPRGMHLVPKQVFMHRMILRAMHGEFVDHINNDGLDNQKSNLRLCTLSQNGANRKKSRGQYSSKYKGVSWTTARKSFKSTIMVNKKAIYLGEFKQEKDAALAYNSAALTFFGPFAWINEINDCD